MSKPRPHRRLTLTRATAPEVTETAIVAVEPPAYARRPSSLLGTSIGDLLTRLQAVETRSEELERRLREPVRPGPARPAAAASVAGSDARREPVLDPDFALKARRALIAAMGQEPRGYRLGAALFLPVFLLTAGLTWLAPRYFVAHARESGPTSRARAGLGFLPPAAAMAAEGTPDRRDSGAAGRRRSKRGTPGRDVEELVSSLKKGDRFDFRLENLVR